MHRPGIARIAPPAGVCQGVGDQLFVGGGRESSAAISLPPTDSTEVELFHHHMDPLQARGNPAPFRLALAGPLPSLRDPCRPFGHHHLLRPGFHGYGAPSDAGRRPAHRRALVGLAGHRRLALHPPRFPGGGEPGGHGQGRWRLRLGHHRPIRAHCRKRHHPRGQRDGARGRWARGTPSPSAWATGRGG